MLDVIKYMHITLHNIIIYLEYKILIKTYIYIYTQVDFLTNVAKYMSYTGGRFTNTPHGLENRKYTMLNVNRINIIQILTLTRQLIRHVVSMSVMILVKKYIIGTMATDISFQSSMNQNR